MPMETQHLYNLIWGDYRHKSPEQTSLPDEPWNGRGDLAKTVGPRDIFNWVYAILHSLTYRDRFGEFLKSDFPRIPLPKDKSLFKALGPLGDKLIVCHLLKYDEMDVLKNPDIRFIAQSEPRVAKKKRNNGVTTRWDNGKIMVNDACWFEDVPREIYEFRIGGYQPLEKWLDDRASRGGANPHPGRVLSDEDILHYRRITVAIRETIALMKQVDEVINNHGGWPDAFYQAPPPQK